MRALRAFVAWLLFVGSSLAGHITLEQFGGSTSPGDDSVAWGLAMASLGTTGGKLELGCGTYQLSSNVTVVGGVEVVGCGEAATMIDCSAVTAIGPCIKTDGFSVRLRSFAVKGANGPGIKVNGYSFIEIEDIAIIDTRAVDDTPWNDSCLVVANGWMVSIRDVRMRDCRTFGLEATGYNTTLQVERLFVDLPKKSGVYLNGVAYAHFSTVGVDHAGDYAYWLKNVSATTFISPGGEAAGKGMFLVTAGDAEAAGAVVPDIVGVVIIAPFSTGNGLEASFYSSLLEARSTNGRKVDVTILGGREFSSPNGKSMILSGSGVRVSKTGGLMLGTVSTADGAVFSQLF